jgi:outer membrane lipoprotein
MMKVRWLGMMTALMLTACASEPPFSDQALEGVDRGFTPQDALRHPDRATEVMWGGVVVGAANFSDHTDFTILSYPLDKQQQPDLDRAPGARFIARYPGYVETMVYQPDRMVTVTGTFQGVEEGKIGQAPYQFPVVKTAKIFLWPVDSTDSSRVHFGFGLGLGVHM